MPGKSWSRWRAITDSSGTNASSPIGTKRGSTSFGTFTRANVSVAGDRVAQPDRERQRQVRDVRERPAGADRQRRQHREDLLGELAGRSPRSSSASQLVAVDHADAVLRERRARARSSHWREWRSPSSRARSAIRSIVSPGDRPSGPRGVDAGVDLVVQAGHAHHVELVEVRGVDREELDPLEQRHARRPRPARARAR